MQLVLDFYLDKFRSNYKIRIRARGMLKTYVNVRPWII